MKVLRKTMFPNEIFSDIEQKDGIIAVMFFLFIFIVMFLNLYLVKISPLFWIIRNDTTNSIYKLIFALLMDIPGFISVIVVLKFRKQKINTIGLRRQGFKSAIYIGISLISMFWIYYISNKGFSIKLIFDSVFYIVLIGFYEELIFRGFLWPRLVVGFGRIWGTILSGLFFGVMHLPIDIVFNNKTIFETFILGNASNINILGGVIVSLWFIFIYTRNSNILLPSFVHGIQDMLAML
ncbi:CPBP family intramembrane glutamic endopeptidase [Clostridium estertheticum]|uniref:CPBP family intramembrane glutamic endopeptidase n=1 Tax=Clostridium estertheticum TaxID=238834 RepID=UPI001C7CDB68|nr:CPBP family intramembrane glutamic endopeptidase [Clostridium estertheticum]MBX4269588.1 CPBP family intramembrane metalloprotease [Clostridium estertheticum]WLC79530.1 CPBP family intramembrane metalloprotease [Clostridium estertheticum]